MTKTYELTTTLTDGTTITNNIDGTDPETFEGVLLTAKAMSEAPAVESVLVYTHIRAGRSYPAATYRAGELVA